jgi:MFS family permease
MPADDPLRSESFEPPRAQVTVAVLLLASLTIMANATIAPSLPGLQAHFADVEGIETLLGFLLTLPSLAIVLSAGLFGWLADRYDRQKLLALSAVLYAAGGTVGLWADSLTVLLIGRAVLGVGVAGTMTLGMTWGADLWQGQARARFLGFQGAAMSAGGIVVMLLGGALATMHWRGAFATYLLVLPVAVFALVCLAPYARRIASRRAEAVAADRPATTAGAFPWAAFAVVGPLGFIFMATFYVMPTRLPFLLSQVGVSNTLVVGGIMASMTLASVPGALLYGRIRRYLSAIQVFAASYALMGLGMLIVSQAQGPGLAIVGSIVMGVGMGPSMPNYTTYFMGYVPPDLRGRASGMLTTAFFAGQFVSPLVSAPLVTWFGLAGAFVALGLALIGLAVVILGLGRWQPQPSTVTAMGPR